MAHITVRMKNNGGQKMNEEKWKISYSVDYWSSLECDWCNFWSGSDNDKAVAKLEELLSRQEQYTFGANVRFRTNYMKQ